MIKILFFGIQSKNHLWEYDFIHNEILPENIGKINYFLNLNGVRSTKHKFDVLVYFCRDPQNYPWGYIPTFSDLLECVNIINPKVIIQLSDEFIDEDHQQHNELGNHCELFLRHHHHPNYVYTDNTYHMPLGYINGFKYKNKEILKIKDRKINWSFIGCNKSDRKECIKHFLELDSFFINLPHEGGYSISRTQVFDVYNQSIFSPITRGWTTLYSHRSFESSIVGSIPIIVGSQKEIADTFKYEENPPWIFTDSWENAVNICRTLLNDKEKLQSMQDEILLWWKNRIGKIKNLVTNCLFENKLKNFPKIYCVGLEESNDRRTLLLDQFKQYGIDDINFLLSKRYPENGHIIESDYLDDNIFNLRGTDCTVSHLRMIEKWLNETNDEYAFFCEDDLSLETVQYWNFTWEQFFNNLPEDWECVQLFIISDHFKVECLELIPRQWNFWGATAYIMKRDYAETLISAYHKDNKYILNPINEEPNTIYWDTDHIADPLHHKLPFVENILFTGIGKTYNCPLFVENTSTESTFITGQKFGHIESHDSILNSWRSHKENEITLQFMSN